MNAFIWTVLGALAIFFNIIPLNLLLKCGADPPFNLYEKCIFCTDYNRQTFQVNTDNQNVHQCGGLLSTSYRAVEFTSKEQCRTLYRPYGPPQYVYRRPATLQIQQINRPTPFQQCLYCTGQHNVFAFHRGTGRTRCSSFIEALPTLFFANGGSVFWQRGECNRLGRPF